MLSAANQLENAIFIATSAHHGQFDKAGKPYILHPLHLMNQLMFDYQLATIAVLHDVIEDSVWTLDDFKKKKFSDRVLSALDLLTHRAGDDYIDDYIDGICTNYDAIRVKRKDLQHNSDITRLRGLQQKDHKRIEKYHHAFTILGAARTAFTS